MSETIITSLITSYIAGNVPTIKDLLRRNKGIEERINQCFDKALSKWSVNSGIRDIERGRKSIHLQELKKILSGNSAPKEYRELVNLWINTLKEDPLCYNFIIENKLEIQSVRLDEASSKILNQLNDGFDSTHKQLGDAISGINDLKAMIKEILPNGNSLDVIEKVSSLVDNSVWNLIVKLQLDSANQILDEIESSFQDIIKKDKALDAKISLQKGMSIFFASPVKAMKLFHRAYQLAPDIEIIKEKECYSLLYEGKIDDANRLSMGLSEDNIIRNVAYVISADDSETAFRNLPDKIRSDKGLRYEILSIRGNQGKETKFLFDGVEEDAYNSLSYHNIFGWLYAMTCHHVKFGGMLFLAMNPTIDNSQYKSSFEFARSFYSLLCKTEVERYLKMVFVSYCYWGFISEQRCYWVDEIMKVNPGDVSNRKDDVVLTQTSMLMMSGRYSEAFTTVASIKDRINVAIANYVILMSFHSNDINYIKWIADVRKQNKFKYSSDSAKYFAFCVNKHNASDILEIISKDDFERQNDYVVLEQLCRHHALLMVDVDLLKQSLEGLTDDMIAYAALVLSEHGEVKLAFELLSPKVDEDKRNFRQRIFLDILNKMPEEKPHLYKILKDNRKSGELCDDHILETEFHLSMKVADYENAYEVIQILYDHYPDEESVFSNFLKLTGRFHPEKLTEYETKVVNFCFKNFSNVVLVYQLYAENKYTHIAAELLYRNVSTSNKWEEKTFYTNQCVTGFMASIAHQKYEFGQDGLYALCEKPDRDRLILDICYNDEVGEKLLGCKEGEQVICKIAGKDKILTIISIVNKYGKLDYDLIRENMTGANPYMKPFTIDENRPLESLEEILLSINPDAKNYHQLKLQQLEDYENGKIGLAQLINDKEIIEDYYNKLFSPSKVFIAPCLIFEKNLQPVLVKKDVTYVLDLPAIIMLFEYQQVSQCKYGQKFIISATTYEYIISCMKNSRLLSLIDFQEAMKQKILVRYNDHLWIDVEIRLRKLVEWMDANCEKEYPDKALALDESDSKTGLQVLLANTISLLLNQPKRCLITDDQAVESNLRGLGLIITTEAYMKIKDQGKDYDSYRDFLIECNYIGVNISKQFVVAEYKKMELAQPNKINYIIQNASYNDVISINIINACVQIAAEANDNNLARITMTNMLAAMIKSLKSEVKGEFVTQVLSGLPSQYKNTNEVKECMRDAAKICNVIMLPNMPKI
jgi:hypothetical protein